MQPSCTVDLVSDIPCSNARRLAASRQPYWATGPHTPSTPHRIHEDVLSNQLAKPRARGAAGGVTPDASIRVVLRHVGQRTVPCHVGDPARTRAGSGQAEGGGGTGHPSTREACVTNWESSAPVRKPGQSRSLRNPPVGLADVVMDLRQHLGRRTERLEHCGGREAIRWPG